ncbi:sugar phosphate isomerase/epimerase family protein [Actinophytocola sp. NPDC049390]|uniref:sugar phosphate isomerase/epimerase family protein n=1 Tax=Actinophytocola sp. NPDC049390 TaxID=3363894 RepID=UPI0037A15DEB
MPAEPVILAGVGDEAAPDLAGQLAAVARAGLDAIELRTVDGVALSDLDDHAFADVVDALEWSDTRVVCVDSRIGNWARPVTGPFELDLDELAVLARRCAVLGCRYVRVMSYPGGGLSERDWRARVVARLRVLADRAEQAGLVLLHENCAGWAGESARRTLDLLAAVDSPALGVLFDTGNGVAHGYAAHDMLSALVDHVAHVHVKDAVAGPRYTLPGQGWARVADCLRLLLDNGYRGAFSLEPHLGVLPHEGMTYTPDAAARFVEAGTALRRLVHETLVAVSR